MYTTSSAYLDYIGSSRIREPKSKIVVDGIEYTGYSHLKTFPKITHSADDIFGVFPAASCEFEIYNMGGDINLYGKEVTVYRGLKIDGRSVEWIPMGLFRPVSNDDVVFNSTTNTIKFKGYDRTVLFDIAHNAGRHSYPCTYGDFLSVLAANHGLSFDSASFPGNSVQIASAPGFSGNTTEREIIAHIAAAFGCIAYITKDGALRVSKASVNSVATAKKGSYQSFSVGEVQRITNVVFTKDGYDDISVSADSAIIGQYGTHTVTVKNNPFIAQTQEAANEFAEYILGLNYCQFDLVGFIDDFCFELNDKITVSSKNYGDVSVVITSLSTVNRIKSTFSSKALAKKTQAKAGSIDSKIEAATQSANDFSELMASAVQDSIYNFSQALGLFQTIVEKENGAKIYYFHNTSNPEEATYVFTFSDAGFGWAKGSGVWNGGNPILQYSVDAAGGAILESLLVRTIIADIINAGKLQSVDDKVWFDLDKALIHAENEAGTLKTDISPTGVNITETNESSIPGTILSSPAAILDYLMDLFKDLSADIAGLLAGISSDIFKYKYWFDNKANYKKEIGYHIHGQTPSGEALDDSYLMSDGLAFSDGTNEAFYTKYGAYVDSIYAKNIYVANSFMMPALIYGKGNSYSTSGGQPYLYAHGFVTTGRTGLVVTMALPKIITPDLTVDISECTLLMRMPSGGYLESEGFDVIANASTSITAKRIVGNTLSLTITKDDLWNITNNTPVCGQVGLTVSFS